MRLTHLLLLMLTLSLPLWAETVRIDTREEQDVMYSARGEDIEILGNEGSIVITGRAGLVTISGNRHDIVVSEAGELRILGSEIDLTVNQVTKLHLSGSQINVLVTTSRPVVSDTGQNNSVVSSLGVESSEQPRDSSPSESTASSPSQSGPIVFNESGRTATIAVGGEVTINGSSNHITLTGRPTALTVNGSTNTVKLESTDRISVNGSQNVVHYSSGRPKIDDVGYGNTVSRP